MVDESSVPPKTQVDESSVPQGRRKFSSRREFCVLKVQNSVVDESSVPLKTSNFWQTRVLPLGRREFCSRREFIFPNKILKMSNDIHFGNSGYGVLIHCVQNQLVLQANIHRRRAISVNFSKSKRGGPQKAIKSNNSVIFKPKIQVRGVFQSVK